MTPNKPSLVVSFKGAFRFIPTSLPGAPASHGCWTPGRNSLRASALPHPSPSHHRVTDRSSRDMVGFGEDVKRTHKRLSVSQNEPPLVDFTQNPCKRSPKTKQGFLILRPGASHCGGRTLLLDRGHGPKVSNGRVPDRRGFDCGDPSKRLGHVK